MTIGHEEVSDFFTTIQQKNNFNIITNHLILFGICEKCQGIAKINVESKE